MSRVRKCILICFTIAVLLIKYSSSDCTFNVKDLPKTHKTPIIVKPGNAVVFQKPNSQGVVTLHSNDKITIACPGNQNIITPGGQGRQVIETFCDSSNVIRDATNITSMGCSRDVSGRVILQSNNCGNNGHVAIVGHDVPAQREENRNFVRSYSICFEGNKFIPSYTRHQMDTSVSGVRFVDRPFFRTGGVVPDLTNDYKAASSYLNRFLGTTSYTQGNQITKGHLVPRADFSYAVQQDATFFYENTAPQWKTINDGNWATIEAAVRRLAQVRRRLEVGTGTFGVVKLRDHRQILQEIYLNGNRRMPIPALFWKAIYDPDTREGVVLFGSNNPFVSLVNLNIVPCDTSICRKLMGWLQLNPFNTKIGEVICCEIKDVKIQVSGLPPVTMINKLLT